MWPGNLVSLACQLASLGQGLPRAVQAARPTGWPARVQLVFGCGRGCQAHRGLFLVTGWSRAASPHSNHPAPTPAHCPGCIIPQGLHCSSRGKVLDSGQLLRAKPETGCPSARTCPLEPAGLMQSRAEPARVRARVWSGTPGPVLGSSWCPSGLWPGVPSCHLPSRDRDSRLRVGSQKLGLSPESDSRGQRSPASWVEPTPGRTPVPCLPGLGAGGSACANNPCGIRGSRPCVPEARTCGPHPADSTAFC